MAESSQAKPWARIAILLVSLVAIALVARFTTGQFLPSDSAAALVFQNALLLVVLGSALIEHKFTEPADSVVNSLMAGLTLLGVYSVDGSLIWWLVAIYCLLTFLFSLFCVTVSSGIDVSGWRRVVADFTYRPAVVLGKARIIFSIVFLYGVIAFFGIRDSRTATLVVFWGVFTCLWPLKIPELISMLEGRRIRPEAIGKILRTDAPNLIRVSLEAESQWEGQIRVCKLADNNYKQVIPLFEQSQGNILLGTGLLVEPPEPIEDSLTPGFVYSPKVKLPISDSEIATRFGGDQSSRLVGFVVEDSTIANLRIETWRNDLCREGSLLWCKVGNEKVFYQITEGLTKEETLEADRHGYQIAEASQLGIIDERVGFKKFTWLPTMNTPVFLEGDGFGDGIDTLAEGDFAFGNIPNTRLQVGGNFSEFWNHHTAIIGTTGSGKTELAFDLVRHALEKGIKVICIDLTDQYRERLEDLGLIDLSITADTAAELEAKLFDVETGSYGAGKEKKALSDLSGQLRDDVRTSIENFMGGIDSDGEKLEGNLIGLITLQEISNTKATLFVTELYLTCLLHYAKNSGEDCPKILIVVEEAHTVMPEPNTVGLGDFESKGLVSKIAQVALQGRKYGVGLLVIAQRTATVSKTILTQCNTMISFNCFDETSIGFMSNIFSKKHVQIIPNLPRLHAIVFGKAVRSEQPVVVEIPYSDEKAARGM